MYQIFLYMPEKRTIKTLSNWGKIQAAVLVKTIITMAHSLGMKVIAEGVETCQQKKFLEENRCDLI